MSGPFLPLATLFGPVLLSALLCGLVIRSGIRDAPDGGRKTQAAPVPNSGGVAILLTLALSAWGLSAAGKLSPLWMENGTGAILAAALVAGVVGLVDDIRGMSARVKLVLVIAVALALAVFGPQLEIDGLAPVLAMAGVALWLVITMNAVNFMDGSNGLAMGSAAIMLFWCADILSGATAGEAVFGLQPDLSALCLAAALAISGFLIWNLQGRLYAGDVGSIGIGALFGGASIVVAGERTIWTAAILFLPFLVDVMLTIAWRARAGQSVMQAHREHAYQLLLRAGWPHLSVAVIWWGLTGLCGYAAATMPDEWAMATFFGLTGIGCAAWLAQRLTLGRRLKAAGL
ncbi:MAG: hypothetical protein KDA53_14005 [Hyphomonas sp.]|nr:hypothetical protein [Hyphomonas sp.]